MFIHCIKESILSFFMYSAHLLSSKHEKTYNVKIKLLHHSKSAVFRDVCFLLNKKEIYGLDVFLEQKLTYDYKLYATCLCQIH